VRGCGAAVAGGCVAVVGLLCGCGLMLCGSCDGVYAVLAVFMSNGGCAAAFLSRLFLCPGCSPVPAVPVSQLFPRHLFLIPAVPVPVIPVSGLLSQP
jgi:hypothetical protein